MNTSYLNQTSYTPVGDITVIALCFAVGLMLALNRVQKGSSYRIMVSMVLAVFFGAITSVVYNVLLVSDVLNPPLIYTVRIMNHVFLSLVQMAYVLYLREPLWMKNEGYNRFLVVVSAVATAPIIIDILGSVLQFGFYITDGEIHSDFTVYPFAYASFMGIIFYLIIYYHSRIIKSTFRYLLGVNILSFIMTAVQGTHHQTSFTTFAYFLPVVGLLFMFHSNPYDQETGAANDIFFLREITSCIEKKTDLVMIYCTIDDFYSHMKQSSEMKTEFFRFFKQNIKRGVLYRFTDDKFVLTMRKSKRGNFDRIIGKMLDDFYNSYENIGADYKLIVAETVPEITSANDYLKLFDFIDDEIGINETHRVTDGDIQRFLSANYILTELEDIARKRDLYDERVLVYCQPVFNVATGTYDTAEALMRLKLPEKGLVFPDKFIPVAEKHGLIHQLSLTILNKTCAEIHDLIAEGYILNRVSVNFSTIDLKSEYFGEELCDIIIRNDIPYEKVAIEITESRSEMEFNHLKSQIMDLQGLGIKFYLDDFGTGYSNFERIMEIPFDIIKLDRSMLIESVKNDSSKYMVTTFAGMFNDLNYSVLFEGVEDERDENACKNMYAKYLQGYKYSKPIPIDNLRSFLEKAV